MASKVNNERSPDLRSHACLIEQQLHIEQIPGMLTIQGSTELSPIEIGNGQYRNADESSELDLCRLTQVHTLARMHCTPEYEIGLDLYDSIHG